VKLVHDEVVYRREVVRTPLRTLAAEIGVSKSAVDQFHKLRSHPGKLWPKLRDWYMRTRHSRAREEYQTPPEELVASALHTLSMLPNDRRAAALDATVEHFKAIHAGMPMPEWVHMLADLAEREAAN